MIDATTTPLLLGNDKGSNPVKYLLTARALASCVPTSNVYHAAARGLPFVRWNEKPESDLDLQ